MFWFHVRRISGWLFSPVVLLFRLLDRLIRLIIFPLRLANEARVNRQLGNLIQGLPVIVIAIGLGVLAIAVAGNQEDLPDEYSKLGVEAFRGDDFGSARLYLERLVELNEETTQTKVDLAVTLEKLGDLPRAVAFFKELAPREGQGHPRAHLWVAMKMLASQHFSTNSVYRRLTYSHLARAERGLQDDAVFNLAMAECLMRTNQKREAAPYLKKAVAKHPERLFELAILYTELRKFAEARETANQSREYLEAKLKEDPSQRIVRMRLAFMQMSLDQFLVATRTLETGKKVDPNGAYDKALSRLCVTQYDKVRARKTGNPATHLALLQAAIGYDRENQSAVVRLLNFARQPGKARDEAREMLEQMLAVGHVPALAHFILGTLAWQDKDEKNALWHLERSFKLDEKFGPVGNNLAWYLANGKSPELVRAKQIIDAVIKQWPGQPTYHDTRGHVLLKMGKYEEALTDLEIALPRLSGNRRLHRDLAAVYRKLERNSLARKHEAIVEELGRDSTTPPGAGRPKPKQ